VSTLNPTNSLLETLGLNSRTQIVRLQFSRVRPGCASVELGPDGIFRISELPATESYCNFKRKRFDFFFKLFPQIASCRPSAAFLRNSVSDSSLAAVSPNIGNKTNAKGIFNLKIWLFVLAASTASLAVFILLGMSGKLSFIAQSVQPAQPAKSLQVAHAAPATLTAKVTPLVAPDSAPAISPVPAPVHTTELELAKKPTILDLPIWVSRDTQNVKPIPAPLTSLAPLPLPNGVIADAKSQKSLASPLGDTKLPIKKIEDAEEPISVTFSSRDASSMKSQNTQPKAEVIAPTVKSPPWIPVTSNDGQLVIRNQGNFSQIKVGGVLPNGETLKSINEASGKFETNTGTYSIKGTE
jgi:hypothetical protein